MIDRGRGRPCRPGPLAATALTALLATSACRTSPPSPTPATATSSASEVASPNAAKRLRGDAASTLDRPATVVRPGLRDELLATITVPGRPAPATAAEEPSDDPRRTIETIARRRLDLAVAPAAEASAPGRVSREATRLYLQGRHEIAAGNAAAAIAPLRESVRLGGGTAALRALADACDQAGRAAEATETRRTLARLGALDESDRRRLVDGLLRRREIESALAVQAAGVVAALDGDAFVAEVCRFAEVMDTAGADGDAVMARTALAALLDEAADDRESAGVEADLRRRFWVASGDDAARADRVALAARRWRRAAAGDDDPAIRRRRLLAEAMLGRDLVVQAILLDAAASPTERDLALVARLRTAGVELDRLAAILDDRIADRLVMDGPWRLLVTVDPERGAAVLDRVAASDRVAVAEPLVAAAFEGGAGSALAVARSFDGSVEGIDAAVRALLAGPIDDETMLSAAIEMETSDPGSLVVAEIMRRHDRPDLAAAVLAAASLEAVPTRVMQLRLAADVADPAIVEAVASEPFDPLVERSRVAAWLASGEPERAAASVDDLRRRLPENAAVLAIAARVASTRIDGALEAVELAAEARRAGDESIETALDLAGFAAGLPDAEGLSPAATRTLATLADDPVFRAILEADAALAAGDAATAIERLDPRLADAAGRDAVLVRLLAAWRTAGRLAEGRRRLAGLVERHPADPMLADALFALDRTLQGPRAVAIALRPEAARAISGQPRRRLELVLAEIPESRAEWRRVARDRVDRRPDGAAVRIERLAFGLETSGAALDEALDAVGAIDVDALAPRQRRRLASVAAAVPDRRGAAIVERIADGVVRRGEPMDVDTAVAVATTLASETASRWFASVRPAAPWTRLDPDWRDRAAGVAGRDVAAADLVATFGLSEAPRDPDDARLLRTATAIGMLAGHGAGTLLDRLDRAAAIGWTIGLAWPDGDADDGRRLGPLASDASMLGRGDLAMELMELAVDERPDDPVALNNLGYELLERGEVARAEALLEASRRLDPDSASTLDSLGWLRFLQGRHDPADPESAVSLVRRSIAIRLDEGRVPSAEVLLHLADATWAAGDRAEAERIWRSLGGTEDEASRQRRLAGIRGYQIEVWGGELVPSASIDRLLEGRWHEAARARLDAVAAGRPPLPVEADVEPLPPDA